MQTNRINVIVGPEKQIFKVPEALFVKYSPVFKLLLPLETDNNTNLPTDSALVFKDFFSWIHSSKPEVDFNKGMDAIFNLAIFAEKYTICPLLNQITDYIQTETMRGKLTLDPADLDNIYRSTSSDETSILRQICSWILVWQSKKRVVDENSRALNKRYAAVFSSHPDLGSNFFLWSSEENVDLVGPCEFHNHSDMPDGADKEENIIFCPYSDL